MNSLRCLIAVITLAALTGCGVELLATTAVEGELQARQLKAVHSQSSAIAESAGRVNLQRAIDTYRAEKGANPPNLECLAPNFIPSVPVHVDGSSYGYDPKTGTVSDHPAPAAPAPVLTDQQKIEQIRTAIDRYGKAVGFYPPSLQALVPTYLAEVPKTAAGQDFSFNPSNGALGVPGRAPAPPSAPAVSAGGGTGPMGEVMTGIGMQQQLNQSSSGGSNRAGSYGREKIGGVTQQYNQQQQQAVDALGQ